MFDSRRQHAYTALTHCNQFLSWSFYVCFLLHVHSPAVHLVCHLPLHIWLFTVLLKYTKDINFISTIFRNVISNRVKKHSLCTFTTIQKRCKVGVCLHAIFPKQTEGFSILFKLIFFKSVPIQKKCIWYAYNGKFYQSWRRNYWNNWK